jgi:hypothetical protein
VIKKNDGEAGVDFMSENVRRSKLRTYELQRQKILVARA